MFKKLAVGAIGFTFLSACMATDTQNTLKKTWSALEWGKPEIVVNENAEKKAVAVYRCKQYGQCN